MGFVGIVIGLLAVWSSVAEGIIPARESNKPPRRRPPPPPPPASPYDHMQINLYWAPVYCRSNPDPPCRAILPSRLFLHGLWPADAMGQTLENCQRIQITSLEDLKKKVGHEMVENLERYWPSVRQSDPDSLWRHEWNKHGVCAIPTMLYKGYFQAGINFGINFDITGALLNAGINPSDTQKYTRSQIESAIQTRIGTNMNIYLGCWFEAVSPHGPQLQLRQIFICFDKYVNKVVSCPVKPDQNCGKPSSVPNIVIPPFNP